VASTSAISPARGWQAGPGGTAKRAEGGKGPAGGQAREPRGAGTLLRAGAAAGLAPALLSAGSGFFRERLPWVTRLRGDIALSSPSGNLSIREIDNPQRRAAHPLCSPRSGGQPAQGGATCLGAGGDVGASPLLGIWPPAAGGGGDASKERFRGAALGRLSLRLRLPGPALRPESQLVQELQGHKAPPGGWGKTL
jgi:hypothetical protein